MDIYSTAAMLPVVRSLRSEVSRYLLDVLFPFATNSDAYEIYFDVEKDSRKIAPFVSPLVEAPIGNRSGYETKSFKPAYVKQKDIVKPDEVVRRMMGEAIGGTLSPAQREQAILIRLLRDQTMYLVRRKVVMAADVLDDGKITVVGDDYPAVTVDFQRDPALTVALAGAARWGETGVSPVDDTSGWLDLVGEKCGAAPDRVIMDPKAWALFQADSKIDRMLDRTLGQDGVLSFGFRPGVPGMPAWKGRIGVVDFFVYQDTYTDTDGTTKTLFPDYTVLVVAVQAMEGVQAQGAILDPTAGYQALEIYPKSWVENDPAYRFLMSQSAPLVYPTRPDASFRARVR